MRLSQLQFPQFVKILLTLQVGLLILPAVSLAGFHFNEGAPLAQTYVIKMRQNETSDPLLSVGFNIKKRFAFSTSPQFEGIYSFNSPFSLMELRQKLQGKFIYLEPSWSSQVEEITVNDPGFTQNSLDIDKQWGLVKAGFLDGWTKTTGSRNTIVAVIDTGIDGTHEDLQKINFVQGFNFLTRQEINGNVNSDDNGHGTLVAGILGATAGNGIGIAGANWQISIMPLKVLNSDGKGDSSDIAEAIVWAADHGANIVNLSLGGIGFGHDTTLASAISYAFNKNVVIIAAAGNDVSTTGGSLDEEPVFPICDDNDVNMIIGVAAVDQNDIKPPFSNYGKKCIDVVAPGKRILSTINHDPFTKQRAPNSYAYASGTSMAVPFVSAQAALLKAWFPQASNVQIRDRIIASADPVDNLNLSQCGGVSCRGLLGSGRINVKKSMEAEISIQTLLEGDVVKPENSNLIYLITGGQKRLISSFVYNQRYQNIAIRTVPSALLNVLPEGPYALPLEGTLVKLDNNPTVYIISAGKKLPLTYKVFKQRGFKFEDVKIISFSELDSWVLGHFLPPTEGTLLRTFNNPTVYWVVGEVLHPINYAFYLERGLNVFDVLYIPEADLQGFPKGEAYIR